MEKKGFINENGVVCNDIDSHVFKWSWFASRHISKWNEFVIISLTRGWSRGEGTKCLQNTSCVLGRGKLCILCNHTRAPPPSMWRARHICWPPSNYTYFVLTYIFFIHRLQINAFTWYTDYTHVSDLRQVGDFLRVHRFPPPIKLTATI